MAVGYAALGEIVRREFHGDAIASQDADSIPPKLAGEVGQYNAFLIELNAKQTAREFLNYRACYFDAIFFAHCPLLCLNFTSRILAGYAPSSK